MIFLPFPLAHQVITAFIPKGVDYSINRDNRPLGLRLSQTTDKGRLEKFRSIYSQSYFFFYFFLGGGERLSVRVSTGEITIQNNLEQAPVVNPAEMLCHFFNSMASIRLFWDEEFNTEKEVTPMDDAA